MEKRSIVSDISGELEFVERLANVTEELEDLVDISKGAKKAESPIISKSDVKAMFKGVKSEMGIPKSLLSVFRLLVVKNLIRGRLFATAYNSGKEIGLSVSVKSKNDFIKATRRFGLGRVNIMRFQPESVRIRLYNGITASGVKKSHRPICFFEAGIFAGFLERVFRKKMNVREIKCSGMGSPYCQFESARLERDLERIHPSGSIEKYSQENIKLLTSLASHAITAIENAILFEKTRRQSVIDGVTQIYNHRYFQTRVAVEQKRAQRYNFAITLFMLDIDNFKKFNDSYGHPKGDEVLRRIATTLVESVRDVDVTARYGGDEFVVILPQTNEQGADVVAKRIRGEIAKQKISVHRKKVNITVSLGGITLEPPALKKRLFPIVDIADKALLKAKQKGKNNILLIKKK
jgi:diguanylate cyclase (GGDEF)-like protein